MYKRKPFTLKNPDQVARLRGSMTAVIFPIFKNKHQMKTDDDINSFINRYQDEILKYLKKDIPTVSKEALTSHLQYILAKSIANDFKWFKDGLVKKYSEGNQFWLEDYLIDNLLETIKFYNKKKEIEMPDIFTKWADDFQKEIKSNGTSTNNKQ